MMNLDGLLGVTVGLCGVDSNAFCLKFEGKRYAFEAIEDESDGYRSMMEEVRPTTIKGHVFFREPVAQVKVEKVTGASLDRRYSELNGYVLRDVKSGHIWLAIGTESYDDYYPCFKVDYEPAHFCSCRVCGKQIASGTSDEDETVG